MGVTFTTVPDKKVSVRLAFMRASWYLFEPYTKVFSFVVDGHNLGPVIGFKIGIVSFGLTPDFLDRDENIISAHKRLCNSEAEITAQDVCERLKSLGIDKLPDFLPNETLVEWEVAV